MVSTHLLTFVCALAVWSGVNTTQPKSSSDRMSPDELFVACGLDGVMARDAFDAAIACTETRGIFGGVLAIADMTEPSTAKRLYLIDLDQQRLVLKTWVAHGRNSGDLRCTSVSDALGSLQTSKGLYRVGAEIISPKHGAALMLHGLDPAWNGHAEAREIIMHGADYVGQDFINAHGRLGRSFGCPAVSKEMMPRMIDLLANGGHLFVYFR